MKLNTKSIPGLFLLGAVWYIAHKLHLWNYETAHEGYSMDQ